MGNRPNSIPKEDCIKLDDPPPLDKLEQATTYSGPIIDAYIHEMQTIMDDKYRETEFNSFAIIPPINYIINSYYPVLPIYGIGCNLTESHGSQDTLKSWTQLNHYEPMISSTTKIYRNKSCIYIKNMFDSTIYVHGLDVKLHANCTHYEFTGNRFLKFDTKTYFKDEDDKQSNIEIMSDDFSTNTIIILQNGSTYISRFQSVADYSRRNLGFYYQDECEYFVAKISKTFFNIKQISCGEKYALLLTSDGKVFNYKFEILESITQQTEQNFAQEMSKNEPVLMDNFVKENVYIESVSCGYAEDIKQQHACFIDKEQRVWFMRDAYRFRDAERVPSRHGAFKSVNAVKAECNTEFMIVLGDDGKCYQLNIRYQSSKRNILSSKILFKDFSVGLEHTVLIGTDDNVYVSGIKNVWKQCGPKEVVYAPWELCMKLETPLNRKICNVIVGANNTLLQLQ